MKFFTLLFAFAIAQSTQSENSLIQQCVIDAVNSIPENIDASISECINDDPGFSLLQDDITTFGKELGKFGSDMEECDLAKVCLQMPKSWRLAAGGANIYAEILTAALIGEDESSACLRDQWAEVIGKLTTVLECFKSD